MSYIRHALVRNPLGLSLNSNTKFEYIVALGSNLGDRRGYFDQAIKKINETLGAITNKASILETAPIGNADKTFLNSAILLESQLPPGELLDGLLAIEKSLGREREIHWGNRTIDLDIILAWEDGLSVEVNTEHLTIPHPQAFNRDFVTIPLVELLEERFPFEGQRTPFD